MFVTERRENLVWIRWEPADGALLAFTTRRGGVSEPPYEELNLGLSTQDLPERVRENRRRALLAMGLDPERLVTAGQIHGAEVRRVIEPGHASSCDALLTSRTDLPLAVSAADCVPVLLWAPAGVAAAHAGWRGLAAGIVGATSRALAQRMGDAAGIQALIGPAIRGCCYTVGPEVAARFDPSCVVEEDHALRLDLPRATRLELERSGVSRVHDLGRCTSCEPYWFYSHRRDGGTTGRLWGVAALLEVGGAVREAG